MNNTDIPATAPELVAAVSSDLTRAERRIAQEVLSDPTLLAFGTVSDLAKRVGTSRPTIVRFAHKLGFKGYAQLQRHIRSDLSHQLSRPSERIRYEEDKAPPARTTVRDSLDSVFEALAGERMGQLAEPLARAEQVWILSGETSLAGAHALRSGLSMVRPHVHLLEEDRFGTDLCDAGPGDAALVMDFYRYRRQVIGAAKLLKSAGVQLVAVTDSPLSPLVELTPNWCEIEVPAIGPFDSSVPAVAISELLVGHVTRLLHETAARRIDHIEALWDETEVFLGE
jgi:DNA-binding MurR/RpiR family transcriptional regulator